MRLDQGWFDPNGHFQTADQAHQKPPYAMGETLRMHRCYAMTVTSERVAMAQIDGWRPLYLSRSKVLHLLFNSDVAEEEGDDDGGDGGGRKRVVGDAAKTALRDCLVMLSAPAEQSPVRSAGKIWQVQNVMDCGESYGLDEGEPSAAASAAAAAKGGARGGGGGGGGTSAMFSGQATSFYLVLRHGAEKKRAKVTDICDDENVLNPRKGDRQAEQLAKSAYLSWIAAVAMVGGEKPLGLAQARLGKRDHLYDVMPAAAYEEAREEGLSEEEDEFLGVDRKRGAEGGQGGGRGGEDEESPFFEDDAALARRVRARSSSDPAPATASASASAHVNGRGVGREKEAERMHRSAKAAAAAAAAASTAPGRVGAAGARAGAGPGAGPGAAAGAATGAGAGAASGRRARSRGRGRAMALSAGPEVVAVNQKKRDRRTVEQIYKDMAKDKEGGP